MTRELWRVGRTVGRTLYRQRVPGDYASEDLVGLMDSRELARLVVTAVNRYDEDDLAASSLDWPAPSGDALFAFAAWCLDLDVPGNVERQAVTLTQIIARARMALGLDQER